MKIFIAFLSAIALLSFVPSTFAARNASKISAFKGKYSGTVNYAGFLSGPTNAVISASKTKERGRISLSSTLLFNNNVPTTLFEALSVNGKKSTFTFRILTISALQRASVKVSKTSIRYSSFFTNGVTYFVNGVALLNKRKLTIIETVTGSDSTTFTISYSLTRKGK